MITIIFVLVAVALVLAIMHLPDTPEETVLNRIQNGGSGPALFDGIPNEVVIDFAQAEFDDSEDRQVALAARAVLHHRGVKWQS